MAEPIGVAAALLGIATFTWQISKEVYDLVNSIQKAPQTIRDLKSELLALDPILSSIHQVVMSDASKFQNIRLPLHQCGMVCFQLKSLVQQCTAHSANGSRNARDWVRMQYKRKTIDGYMGQLASYKATIGITLSLFTLNNSALTANAVNEIKATIYDTISQTLPDLKVLIEEITKSLDGLAVEALKEDRLALEAEKKALEQSQQVCTTAKQQIEGATPQLDSPFNVTFLGASNSGLQLGQNTGVISNISWGVKP